EKAVAATSNGFHKARTLGRVAECLTDLVDRLVEPVIEVHESVCRPESCLKFLASYDLAGMLEQHHKDLEGLFLKPNSQPLLAQFASAKIQLENSKAEPAARLMIFLHRRVNQVERVYCGDRSGQAAPNGPCD